jgi:hypothetical protein
MGVGPELSSGGTVVIAFGGAWDEFMAWSGGVTTVAEVTADLESD